MRIHYVILCCSVCIFYAAAAEEQCRGQQTVTFTHEDVKNASLISKIETLIQGNGHAINRNISFTVKFAETEQIQKFNTCEINVDGVCYWSHVESDRNLSCCDAWKICQKHESKPASILSLKAYHNTTASVRKKMHGLPNIMEHTEYRIWTGVEYSTEKEEYIHFNVTSKDIWRSETNLPPVLLEKQPLVSIALNTDIHHENQGLALSIGSEKGHSVLCQHLKEPEIKSITSKCICPM